eukprot:CAMPEP_0198705294 /NCGR_PEP_ID=MMETSP1468-20131203/390358_1 /TAXON_ID=1461545 /ORGANISM="Mantoniella sp, Strain CCMP1436" /LENGTH=505 /DNA_ID=CAMNT_0044464161 /DNA_START=90 /DNA_END=1607 /DNA_ORIENTATION=-
MALSHAGFLRGSLPMQTRSSSSRNLHDRVLVTPCYAKGQKGMRKVLANPAEQFTPNSLMGRMMNVRLNKINWKVLADAADKAVEGELASQPILGLVRTEVLLRGMDVLTAEDRGYKEYIILRSLGLKAWFTLATSRAGVIDPTERCAVGKALALPGGEYNIYRRILVHAPKAADGDWNGFADGLADDARAVRDGLTEDSMKTVKVRYDVTVTAANFEYIAAQITAAAAVAAAAKAGDAPRAVALMVPWVDPGLAPGGGSAKQIGDDFEAVAVAEDDVESDIESMFGKKKKKKKVGVGGAAAAAIAAAGKALGQGAMTPSLNAVLSQLVKKQAEPTFPEVDAWIRGRGGGGGGSLGIAQATGSEAVAAAAALALAAPSGATVVAPSALFASALTFDLGTLGPGPEGGAPRRVLSAAAAAKEESWSCNDSSSVALFITFDPPSEGLGADGDADLAAAVARASAAHVPVVVCTVALAPGGACDAVKGTKGTDEAAAEAVVRATTRAKL